MFVDDDLFIRQFHRRTRLSRWGCVEWTGCIAKGYGLARHDSKALLAHRVVWAIRNGDPTEGLVIDHLCCNTRCVNPEHLEQVTAEENGRRITRPAEGWIPVGQGLRRQQAQDAHLYTATGRRRKVA